MTTIPEVPASAQANRVLEMKRAMGVVESKMRSSAAAIFAGHEAPVQAMIDETVEMMRVANGAKN